jgi:glycosyltransferase involved in cell wall biosynthesis
MNVLFVSDSTTVSGAEIVLLGCGEALQSHGHRPFGYIRRSNPRLIEAFRTRGWPFTTTNAFSEEVLRTTLNPVALAAFGKSMFRVSREMVNVIRTNRIDVIHSISYPAALYAGIAGAWTRTPHIWHEHNIKRIHRVNRPIYRRVGKTCSWVVGPSDAVTGNLRSAGIERSKLRTVYNGIDLSRFRNDDSEDVESLKRELGISEGETAIGLFGQMLPYKGHRTLIEAAPRIVSQYPRTRFFFVGALENPPYQAELQTLLWSKGLTDRFHFTGWRHDVHNIIRAMDIVVVATITPEPAALMLMEAMAMERPIVATRTGGTPEIIEDNKTGLLFDPDNAAQLADQLSRLLADEQLARPLGVEGRKRVELKYSQKHHVDVMLDLYARAVSNGMSRPGAARVL